jgi:uncharacterized protein YycO
MRGEKKGLEWVKRKIGKKLINGFPFMWLHYVNTKLDELKVHSHLVFKGL